MRFLGWNLAALASLRWAAEGDCPHIRFIPPSSNIDRFSFDGGFTATSASTADAIGHPRQRLARGTPGEGVRGYTRAGRIVGENLNSG